MGWKQDQAKEQPKKAVLVRAKVTHTQPGSLTFREKGEEFQHIGDVYEHVEPVRRPQPAEEAGELAAE